MRRQCSAAQECNQKPNRSACGRGVKSEDVPLRLKSQAGWWSQTESNRRPLACHASALPTELWPHLPWIRRPVAGWPDLRARCLYRDSPVIKRVKAGAFQGFSPHRASRREIRRRRWPSRARGLSAPPRMSAPGAGPCGCVPAGKPELRAPAPAGGPHRNPSAPEA
jgi:hypothetical protein